MTRPDQTRPDQNYGLSLLKIWMSFEVVLTHFWHSDTDTSFFFLPFKVFRPLAVPIFMFTAFLLTGKMIEDRNSPRITKRLGRLAVMQVLWAAIYTVFFIASAFLMNKGPFAGKSALHVFLMFAGQVLLGHTVNATMWFQADLILITAVFALVYFRFTGGKSFTVIFACFIAAVLLQYSGVNFMLFGGLHDYLRYTPGRFCEMLPSAFAGMLFVKYGLAEKLQARRNIAVIICAGLFVVFSVGEKLAGISPPEGFGY